jgi:hypothetical protein
MNVKIRIRRYAVLRLKRIGITRLNGKALGCCKSKDVFDLYLQTFFTDAKQDYFSASEKSLMAQKDTAIKSKTPKDSQYVYVIGNLENSICKIGYSKSPVSRLKTIQTGCPYKLHFIVIVKGNISIESQLHEKYRKYKSNGEWFHYKGDLKLGIEKIKNTEKNIALQF